MKKNSQKPILFATLGFPGSGKTYFSRRFAKEFHILHLNSDRIRKALFKKPKYTQWEHDIVFRLMDTLAEEALSSGIPVIYDANSTRHEYRDDLMHIAKEHHADYWLLWVKVSQSKAKERLGTRKRCTRKVCQHYHPPVPLDVFDRLRKTIEPPDEREPTIILKGTDTYAKQKKTILQRVSFEP